MKKCGQFTLTLACESKCHDSVFKYKDDEKREMETHLLFAHLFAVDYAYKNFNETVKVVEC